MHFVHSEKRQSEHHCRSKELAKTNNLRTLCWKHENTSKTQMRTSKPAYEGNKREKKKRAAPVAANSPTMRHRGRPYKGLKKKFSKREKQGERRPGFTRGLSLMRTCSPMASNIERGTPSSVPDGRFSLLRASAYRPRYYLQDESVGAPSASGLQRPGTEGTMLPPPSEYLVPSFFRLFDGRPSRICISSTRPTRGNFVPETVEIAPRPERISPSERPSPRRPI